MDRTIFGVITLLICFSGAVFPDVEHLTAFLGLGSYGLHSSVVAYVFIGVSITFGCGLITRFLLRRNR
jgi:hypothetical protein